MEKIRRILVLDASRVVRATLGKHLKDDFEVIEEANGESAWQLLMLDSRICAVITGIHPLKLEAHDLLERIKASSIKRLRETPFLLIVSDLDNHVGRDADRARGVSGFLTKTMSKAELIDSLNAVLTSRKPGNVHGKTEKTEKVEKAEKLEKPEAVPEPQIERSPKLDFAPGSPATASPTESSVSTVVLPPQSSVRTYIAKPPQEEVRPPAAATPKLYSAEQLVAGLSTLRIAGPNAEMACVLVFGIDNRAALIEQFGAEVAEMISSRLASMLMSKMGPHDVIGQCTDERLAIVSQGVDLKQGIRFGKQVCKSLAAGQISIRGEKIKLTASVGVASTSDDYLVENNELLWLANRRLDQAFVCGGNTVASEFKPGCLMHGCDPRMITLVEALKSGKFPGARDKLGSLGLIAMPLLREINRELLLGLDLDDIEQRLRVTVAGENSSLKWPSLPTP